jgi:hypothetical protein
MRRPLSRLTTIAATAAVLGAAACGGSTADTPKDPKGELTASVENLGASDVLTTTLRLDTTAEALQSFAAEDGDKLSTEDAEAIASAQIVVEVRSANGDDLSELKGGDDNAANVSFRFVSNDDTLAELRVVDGDLYLQGDLRGILALIHESDSYADVQQRVSVLPHFVQAFVEGQWVSIDGAAAKGLAGSLSGAQTPSDKQGQKLLEDLKGIVQRDVTVTREGSDDRGDHLVLTGNTKALAQDFVQAASGALPAGSAAMGQFNPDDVPDRDVTVDAWVKDGVLTEISLDIVQFAKPGDAKAGDSLPIAITFEQEGDDIGAPEDVTPVDLTQLGSLLGAMGSM